MKTVKKAVKQIPLDLKPIIGAWKDLNKLVPLSVIANDKDFLRCVKSRNALFEAIGESTVHPLYPLLDILARQISAFEADQFERSKAPPGHKLAYLMKQNHLKPEHMLSIFCSQTTISLTLTGRRAFTLPEIKALAKRFNVSPTVFM